jgi:flagellar biosynthesis/type III secretory pathway protein FliH
MELEEAIKILKEYLELNEWRYPLTTAIEIVLERLEITTAMKEVAFEEGYKKGKHSGTQEGFYSGVAMGTQQRKYIDEKTIKIKDEYLKLIDNLLIDYDGCKTVKSLKELIDETREYIHKALKNDDKSVITVNSKKKFNILGEEVE